jgi:hypothetical protein
MVGVDVDPSKRATRHARPSTPCCFPRCGEPALMHCDECGR